MRTSCNWALKALMLVVCMAIAGQAYTILGYYRCCWAGSGGGDALVADGGGLLPKATSNCPADPDMAYAVDYQTKIYNGIDTPKLQAGAAGNGQALVLDWTHASSGWTLALIAGALHWPQLFPPSGANCALIFWAKGETGGEQKYFKISMHNSADQFSGEIIANNSLPAITPAWQRIVVPWSSFPNMVTAPTSVSFKPYGVGKMVLYIDQMYLSNRVTVDVLKPVMPEAISSARATPYSIVLNGSENGNITAGTAAHFFDLTGRMADARIGGAGAIIVKELAK